MIKLFSIEELTSIAKSFANEISQTLDDKPTSLSHLKNPIPQTPLIDDDEPFQIMVIGGSNFVSCVVTTDSVTDTIHPTPLPIFSDASTFLRFIESHLDTRVKTLAINFAYPLKPTIRNGILDGVLLYGTKEHALTGLIGKPVGGTIENYLNDTLKKTIRVTVANDTVCLLLSATDGTDNESQAAGVIGTGTNLAIVERGSIINLESGNFDKFPQTETGALIDQDSENPDRQRFEKEVSGAYLYKHYNLLSVIPNSFRDPVNKNQPLQSTEELSIMAQNSKDLEQQSIAQNILERSAQLVAAQIAGIAFFKKRDLMFVMEGSLYWKGFHYKEMIDKYLKLLPINTRISMKKSPDQAIKGARRLVLLAHA